MLSLTNWLIGLFDLFHSLKDKHLQWRQSNQHRQAELKHQLALSEKALEAELRKKSVQLKHEISLLTTKNATELSMLKIKCKQDIQDYKQYLASLDRLKASILNSYTHLPESVAFTIHHHAKYLLHNMWEAEDLAEKMEHELKLIQFMSTVHEEAGAFLEGSSAHKLPERTLRFISEKDHSHLNS